MRILISSDKKRSEPEERGVGEWPLADQKRYLFVKIFKQEFLRELQYLWDVANGRASARDTFTTQLVNQLNGLASLTPVVGSAIDKLIAQVAEFAANSERDRRISTIAKLTDQLDLHRLEILLDVVSQEALRRYESFIVDRLSDTMEDGVIPFARIGARRVLEKLSRSGKALSEGKGFELSESLLLSGLVEGRSGSFVEGFANHLLTLRTTKKGLFGRETIRHVDAEEVYARSGMRHFEIRSGKVMDTLYVRKTAQHKELSRWKKIQEIYKGETDSLYNFGYVKFRKKYPQDPKAGYVLMPLSVIVDRYDFKPQDVKDLSPELQAEVRSSSLSRVVIDRETVKLYLSWAKMNTQKSLLDFVRDVLKYPGVQSIVCRDSLEGLELKGANLSHTDLSGAFISGDLTGTNFSHCYLMGSTFYHITSTRGASFHQARCEFLQAQGVDFSDADLTQANFNYANLKNAKLIAGHTLGAQWVGADLSDTVTDADLYTEQKIQTEQVKKKVEEQSQVLAFLQKDLVRKTNELYKIQQTFAEQTQTQLKELQAREEVQAEQLKTYQQTCQHLQAEMQKLIQYQESRLAFEEYCKTELQMLEESAKNAASQEQLMKTQMQLVTVQNQMTALLSSHPWDQALENFKERYQTQFSHLGGLVTDLQKGLHSVEAQLKTQIEIQAKAQTERLGLLEKSIQTLRHGLIERLSQLENRVGGVEKNLSALKITVDQAKGKVSELETKAKKSRPEFTVAVKLLKLREVVLKEAEQNRELAYYVPPHGEGQPELGDVLPLESWVQKEFLASKARVLLLQGQAGAGKSTFNQHLLRTLWNDKAWQTFQPGQKPPPVCAPFFIPLGASQVDPKRLFNTLLDLPEIVDDFTEDEINVLKKEYHLLFIADGYDEMASLLALNLYDVNQLNQYEGRVKLLVSCRSQRAQELDEDLFFVPHDASGQSQYQYFKQRYIAPFNDTQIASYIQKFIAKNKHRKDLITWPEAATYQKYIEAIPDLKELINTPFLLMITVEIMPQLAAQTQEAIQENQKETRAKLYDRFVKRGFERQIEKARRSGGSDLPSPKEMLTDYQQFCFKFAKCLREANVIGVQYPYRGTSNLFDEESTTVEDPKGPRGPWVEKLFGSTHPRIVQAQKGNPFLMTQRGYRQFIHPSFIDYFYTTAIWHQTKREQKEVPVTKLEKKEQVVSLLDMDDETLEVLMSKNPLTRDQIEFLANRVDSDAEFKNRLFELIERSKKEMIYSQIASNAISVLNAAGIGFAGRDWRDIRIPGADLRYALLDHVALNRADLTRVNLTGAWMTGSDLSEAKMREIRLGERPSLDRDGYITALSYSPQGRLLAIAEDKDIHLFDAMTSTPVAALKEHADFITGITFHPQGSHLLASSGDTLYVWDLTKPTLANVMKHSKKITSVAFHPKASVLAFGSTDATIYLWNPRKGEQVVPLKGHNKEISCIAFHPQGTSLVSGSDKTLSYWNMATLQRETVLEGHHSPITCMAFHPQGITFASAGRENTIYLWDMNSRTLKARLEGHASSVNTLVFHPQGTFLASGSWDKTIRLWDLNTHQTTHIFGGHTECVTALSFHPQGAWLASGGMDKKVRLQEIAITQRKAIKAHSDNVYAVAFDLSGQWFASGSRDKTVGLWNRITRERVAVFKEPMRDVMCLTFSAKSTWLISGSADNTIHVWDLGSKKQTHRLSGHTHKVMSVASHPKLDNIVASASLDSTICLWDLASDRSTPRHILRRHGRGVTSIAFDPQGKYLVSAGWDAAIGLWEVDSGKLLATQSHSAIINCLAFHPLKRQLAFGSQDNGIYYYDLNKKKIELFGKHSHEVTCIAYRPNGAWLVSCSLDRTVRIWDTLSGHCLGEIKGFLGQVNCLSWFETEKEILLLTGSDDHAIRYWRIEPKDKGIQATLLWSSQQTSLTALNTRLDRVIGLDANASLLFKQRGAVVSSPKTEKDQKEASSGVKNLEAKSAGNAPSSFKIFTPAPTEISTFLDEKAEDSSLNPS